MYNMWWCDLTFVSIPFLMSIALLRVPSLDNATLSGAAERNAAGSVFPCCLLISLLRWPHCAIITEGGWPALRKSLRESSPTLWPRILEQRLLVTLDGVQTQDSAKASLVCGGIWQGQTGLQHLSPSNAAGTRTPDTAHDFTHRTTHTHTYIGLPTTALCYAPTYVGEYAPTQH